MFRSTSNWIDGDWIEVKDNQITVNKLLEGCKDVNPSNFVVEGVSAFTKGSKQAFLVVSMREHGLKEEEEQESPGSTHVMIVRMKQNFLEVVENAEHRVVFFERLENSHRESFRLFIRRGTYYMTYSSPNIGAREGSDFYYRTSPELEGPWSKERNVLFLISPSTRDESQGKNLQSFASLHHRYIMKINGQWVYAGDRLHHNESQSLSDKYHNIIVPVKWRQLVGKPDQPVAIWKQEWDIIHCDGSGPDPSKLEE